MQGPRLEAAREAARAALDGLRGTDIISVVVFDSEATVLVPPTIVGNKKEVSAKLNELTAGGGTNIFPGLKEAHETLDAIKASKKHVILLSDGEAPTDGIADLVADMRASKITTSAVGIPGADRNLLSIIADAGAGRLYMVEDLGALPKIFMKEVREGLR
jgi:Mg-chelatase subunit ChlD